jgi:hypothetical protein
MQDEPVTPTPGEGEEEPVEAPTTEAPAEEEPSEGEEQTE